MSERAGYSRVYWTIIDDPKFVTIFDDDHNLAAWLRLLMTADQAHPASATLPVNVRKTAVRALVDAGIVDTQPNHRYRIHGLDAERDRRRIAATSRGKPADRTVTERSPDGFAMQGLRRDETRRDETRHTARTGDDVDPADIYWRLTGKYPGDKVLPWLDQLTERYGAESVCRSLAVAHIADRSAATLLGRTQDALRAEARVLDIAERKAEQARLAEKRAVPRVLDSWREEYRQGIQERYGT